MKRLFLIFLTVLFLNFLSNSQNTEFKTKNVLKENISENDTLTKVSIEYSNDSIVDVHIQDSIKTTLNVIDTVITEINIDTLKNIAISDTTSSEDPIPEINSYNQILNYVKDSLYFEKPDSIHYVIYNLNNLMNNDTIPINDTTKQAIDKLINYSKSREIESVIEYLQSRLKKSELLYKSEDSSIIILNDSISRAIEYLITSIPDDTIKFSFTNLNNDSILFESAEHEIDSIRLNLVDNRGEYGVLWIRKSDNDVFDIFLEDGVFLEKTRHRKMVEQRIGSTLVIPEIRDARKVDITVAIWEFEGLADIRFNQGYVSKSWSKGGENNMSALSVLKYSADYTYGKKRYLDTDIEYKLGYLKAGDRDIIKNDDKLEINANYGKQAVKNWYYSGLLNFRTQIFKGKEYINDSTINTISNILSPAYLVFSIGMDYKPSNKLTILFSPLTSKFTIVADTSNYDQTRYGVAKDEFFRKELGAYVKAISKLKFRDNIILENKINFFTNYSNNPQNIDVDWEIDLNVKLNDYIKMSINTHLIYDDDVAFIDEDGKERGARAQFKELFGIGFIYGF